MLSHIRYFGCSRDHGLLLDVIDSSIFGWRRVLTARISGLIGSPALDFIFNWGVNSVAATSAAASEAPAAKTDKQGKKQGCNDSTNNRHNQSCVVYPRMLRRGRRGGCCGWTW